MLEVEMLDTTQEAVSREASGTAVSITLHTEVS